MIQDFLLSLTFSIRSQKFFLGFPNTLYIQGVLF